MARISTYEQAYEANQRAGGSLFPGPVYTRRMYGVTAGREMHGTDHGAYFVTSVRRLRTDKRTYQVRFIDGTTGRVTPVATDYQTNYGAQLRAKQEAEANQHGCQFCAAPHSPGAACTPL
jgi:hypothetical protein